MLDDTDPIADVQDLRMVVRDNCNRDLALRTEFLDQVQYDPPFPDAHRRKRLVAIQRSPGSFRSPWPARSGLSSGDPAAFSLVHLKLINFIS